MTDILKEATGAFREQMAPSDDSARFTRGRVMSSLHRQRRTRRTRLTFLVPLAAILVGSSAWAAATGKLPAVWHAVSWVADDDAHGERQATDPGSAQPGLVGSAAEPAAAKLDVPEQAEQAEASEAPEPTGAAASEPDPDATDSTSPAVPSKRPAGALPPVKAEAPDTRTAADGEGAPIADPAADGKGGQIGDPTHDLYRAAHHAHFGGASPATALAAWDRYLARGGRFALEARYNRGICLVRLGRYAEARAELEPFARGDHGSYRQRSAQQLLDAIGQR